MNLAILFNISVVLQFPQFRREVEKVQQLHNHCSSNPPSKRGIRANSCPACLIVLIRSQIRGLCFSRQVSVKSKIPGFGGTSWARILAVTRAVDLSRHFLWHLPPLPPPKMSQSVPIQMSLKVDKGSSLLLLPSQNVPIQRCANSNVYHQSLNLVNHRTYHTLGYVNV